MGRIWQECKKRLAIISPFQLHGSANFDFELEKVGKNERGKLNETLLKCMFELFFSFKKMTLYILFRLFDRFQTLECEEGV